MQSRDPQLTQSDSENAPQDFAAKASSAERTSLPLEFWLFLKHNKKWWLGPIVAVILMIAAIAVTGAQQAGIAPFIYTLF